MYSLTLWSFSPKPWMAYGTLKHLSPSDPSDAVKLFPSSPDEEPLEKFRPKVSPLVCHPLGSLGGMGGWTRRPVEVHWPPARTVPMAVCVPLLVTAVGDKNLQMAPEISGIDREKLPSGAASACACIVGTGGQCYWVEGGRWNEG